MNAWLPLLITLFIQAMVAMALATVPVLAPVASKALAVSPALVGVFVALNYAGALLASLVSSTLVGRYGPIRVSQWGLAICALGLLVCAVPAWPAMALGAVLIGLGYGPITPASSHLLARTTPARQMSLVFSVKQTGVPLGGLMAGAIVPPLLLGLDWQLSLLAVGAACLACAVLSQRVRAELDADRQPGQSLRLGNLAQPIRLVLAHRPLATMAACSFVFSIIQLSLGTYLVTYLHDELAYGLVAAGLALSFTQAGGMLGRIGWGYVADRWWGASNVLVFLAGLMGLSALATAFLTPAMPSWLLWSILVTFGASAIGWNGIYLAEVARQAPSGMASMATGGTLAFTFLGVVIGPPIFGALSAWFGSYRAGFLALMVTAGMCGVMLLWMQRRSQALAA